MMRIIKILIAQILTKPAVGLVFSPRDMFIMLTINYFQHLKQTKTKKYVFTTEL